MVGSIAEFGEWDVKRGKKMTFTGIEVQISNYAALKNQLTTSTGRLVC